MINGEIAVARLGGTNEEEGRQILAEANFPSAATLGDAAEKVVALAQAQHREA